MKIAGIIAEYNPFHNGHKYQIEETRRITGADYIIAVVSGNFVQRGAPAIADKHLRAEAALQGGVDLVLELPLFYAAGSAEYFAAGAVTLLDKLGVVDSLCFGSECGSILPLSSVASILVREPENYRELLQKELKKGQSFPKARSLALASCLSGTSDGQELLSLPNNILGIEYIKTLLKRNSPITPYTIKRKGNNYHDTALPPSNPCHEAALFSSSKKHPASNRPQTTASNLLGTGYTQAAVSNLSGTGCTQAAVSNLFGKNRPQAAISGLPAADGQYCSASAIRNALAKEPVLSHIQPYLPGAAFCLLENALHRSFPIYSNDFSSLLHYKLIQEAPEGFARYLDITDSLSDKICRYIFRFTDYESFCRLLKSKDITYSRLSRGILHILLNMTWGQMDEYVQNDYIAYARILGFRKTSAPLLKKIKTHTSIPMVSKLSCARRRLSPTGLAMLEQDIQAAHIYNSVAAAKYHTAFTNEYERRLIIL